MRNKLFAAAFMLVFVFSFNVAAAQDEQSAEAAEEVSVDIKKELGLEDYKPTVPKGLFGKIGYSLKNAGRNIQEVSYKAFASDESYAKLTKQHAEEQAVEAEELYKQDPGAGGQVIKILERYKDDLAKAEGALEKMKEENPEGAASLAEEMTREHMFNMPRMIAGMEDRLSENEPEIALRLEKVKDEMLKATGGALAAASDDPAKMAETLKKFAQEQQPSRFSGFAHAEVMSKMKDQMKDQLPPDFQNAFDEAIKTSLDDVEQNLKQLPLSNEKKAENFGQFISQLPGGGLERMKMIDQFRSQTGLPAEFLGKMQEAKARVADMIGEKIRQGGSERQRQALTSAFLDVKNPNVDDLKTLEEMKDLMPEEIKNQIEQNHEANVKKFLDRFGDDGNAKQVTAEFQNLTNQLKDGQIAPDANFFKTLDSLQSRLAPEQRKFISEMKNTGQQEFAARLQSDKNFVDRVSTSNPADVEVFQKVKQDLKNISGQDFSAKFGQIEQRQADNFKDFLGSKERSEDVEAIKQKFQNDVPPEVQQKFKNREEDARQRGEQGQGEQNLEQKSHPEDAKPQMETRPQGQPEQPERKPINEFKPEGNVGPGPSSDGGNFAPGPGGGGGFAPGDSSGPPPGGGPVGP